jgi:hypothetical protein
MELLFGRQATLGGPIWLDFTSFGHTSPFVISAIPTFTPSPAMVVAIDRSPGTPPERAL